MSLLSPYTCVQLYIDGWRDVVVLSHGPKWLRGFEAATLSLVKLPSDAPSKPCNYPQDRLVRRLKRNAKTYNMTETVKLALKEMRAGSRLTAI